MSHYWARRTFRQPQERAIGFAYAFLGIRIQCAQCHKHPFDQWTKDDFAQFQGFFTGVNFGTNPKTRTEYNELMAALNLGDKKGGQARKAVGEALLEGKTVPFQEVYVISPKQASSKNKKNKNAGGKAARQIRQQLAKQQQRLKVLKADNGKPAQIKQVQEAIARLKKRQKRLAQNGKRRNTGRVASSARLLGDEQVDLTKFDDVRTPLMDWLRRKDNRLFARAFVNRVWASYFGRGLVEPADDLNLANPPTNAGVLEHLAKGFVESGYDMKWVHLSLIHISEPTRPY